MPATPVIVPENRWNDDAAAKMSEAELLRYRSNLLGADLAVTNFGGGNTSAKIMEHDPLSGEEVPVLWVKGSGGDLGSIDLGGFSTLYLDRLRGIERLYRGIEHEDEMVGYLPHCTFDLNPRAASIDTPLHTFLTAQHIDHTHPDAVIAIAATSRSEALTKEIFGDRIGWLPWQRPGFDLGLRLRDLEARSPDIEGVVLEGHGLFTWGKTSKETYLNTIQTIAQAALYLNRHFAETEAFSGAQFISRSTEGRQAFASQLMPVLRNAMSGDRKVGHFSASDEVLEFVNSTDFAALAALGTSCPDHFLRTKIKPLIIDPIRFEKDGVGYLNEILSDYRDDYARYYERHRTNDSPPMRDANPVICLIPTVGMVSFAKDKATARISGEFYQNAVNVMRGAEAIDRYQGLPQNEAFAIEYWQLEEAKLRRSPPPKPFTGQVVLVTGGAGGIGRATAAQFLGEGACVVLCDIDREGLERAREDLTETVPAERVLPVFCNVTSEEEVAAAFSSAALAFGGVDVVVANAGLASSAPVEETSLELWKKNQAVLSDGYFLTAREAFKMFGDAGGSIVFVASKNALAASPNASAYCTAKASEVHLARCLALEGAGRGIRVNVVNPDAVLSGSKIWTGNWRAERAAAYGLTEQELEDHYRDRSLLKRSVLPEDIAEAIIFLSSEKASKSTGNILNVDAGNAASFPR